MKKQFYYLLVVIAFFILSIYSCKKDELQSKAKIDSSQIAARGGDCFDGINRDCGLLMFNSLEHFQSVYECLEDELEAHCDAMENANANLSDEDYNDLIESTGWDESQPLADFEATASHRSYRMEMENAEDLWLANGATGPHPDESAITDDEILATILSSTRGFIIGNVLYYYGETGTLYTLEDYTCQALTALQADPVQAMATFSKISIWAGPQTGSCENWDKDDGVNNYSIGRKYKWHHSFKYYPWGTVIHGNAKSYKKKTFGGWKKYRTNIEINPYGDHYDYVCAEHEPYNVVKSKRRRLLHKKIVFWGELHQYLPGQPHCGFTINSGHNTSTIN